MKFNKRIIMSLTLTTLMVAVSVTNVFGQARSAPQIEATLFGLQTMTAGQTLRLAVVNRQSLTDGEIIPCVRVRVVFDIYEAIPPDQQRLRFARRVERTVTLDPGEAAAFDFGASRMGGERVSVAVFVHPEDRESPEAIRGTAIATLEVRESSRTLFTLPGVIRGFDPQPDPPQTQPSPE